MTERFTRTVQPARRHAAGMTIAVLLALRLLAIDTGFGADTDAWRAAASGSWLELTGEYVPSRRPGYPVVEAVLAALSALESLVRGPGWWVVNVVTVGVFGGVLARLLALARRMQAVNPALLLATYGSSPSVFDQSLGSLDFHLPILLALAALAAADKRRAALAGILLGFAMGARLTTVVALAGTALVLWRSGPGGGRLALRCAAVSALLGAVLYSPTLARFGTDWLPEPQHLESRLQAWGWLGIHRFLGIPATIALAVTLWTMRRALYRDCVEVPRHLAQAAGLSAVLFGVVFLLFPYDANYLLLVWPFVLLLVARCASTRMQAALLICVIVNGVVALPGLRSVAPGRIAVAVSGPGEFWTLWHLRLVQRNMPAIVDHVAHTPRVVLLDSSCLPALWFHWRREISGGGEWRQASHPIRNFNTALYNAKRDVYVVPRWDRGLLDRLGRDGYTTVAIPELRHLEVPGRAESYTAGDGRRGGDSRQ